MNISPFQRNVALAVGVIVLLAVGNWYVIDKSAKTPHIKNGSVSYHIQPTGSVQQVVQTDVKPNTLPQANSSWNSFHDRGYDLKYPKNWQAEYSNTFNMVHFYNQGDKVSISIYEKASPFPDFSGNVTQQNSINISLNGQTYNTTEYILNGRSAYINLDTSDSKNHSILIGSDYPAKARGTLDDYYREKETVLKILESLRFY